MAETLILHHYDASPFSEKIRKIFGLKRLKWRAVEQPSIMPKPDLVPLTGGYRPDVLGTEPRLADATCFQQVWFLRVAPQANAMVEEFRRVSAWRDRVDALGHGERVEMPPAEALAIAKESRPTAEPAADPREPNGLEPGDAVSVVPDDYGLDPVAGELVFSTVHEIAVRRRDAALGEIVVHFPRFGFRVTRGA